MFSHWYTDDLWKMTAKFELSSQGIMHTDMFISWCGAPLGGALQRSEPSETVSRKESQEIQANAHYR